MKTKVVIGVCGSVAAIEIPRLIRRLRRKGIEVECVMSEAARKIIVFQMSWNGHLEIG